MLFLFSDDFLIRKGYCQYSLNYNKENTQQVSEINKKNDDRIRL